jgi:hypothetical protein
MRPNQSSGSSDMLITRAVSQIRREAFHAGRESAFAGVERTLYTSADTDELLRELALLCVRKES